MSKQSEWNCPGCLRWCSEQGQRVCPDCRRQLAIGKAIEAMPQHTALYHGVGHDNKSSWEFDPDTWYGLRLCVIAATPLEALTKGGKG